MPFKQSPQMIFSFYSIFIPRYHASAAIKISMS